MEPNIPQNPLNEHIMVPNWHLNHNLISDCSQIKSLYGKKRKKNMLDNTDSTIIKLLIQNSALSARQISEFLKKSKIHITERAVRKRISGLLKNGVIKNYTIIVDDLVSGKNVNRLILVKFRNVQNFLKRLEEYKKYVSEAPYCIFAMRVRGEFDWMHFKCFPTKELADMEDDTFRAYFGDIMEEYRAYDAEKIKTEFNAIIDSEDVQKYIQRYNSTS